MKTRIFETRSQAFDAHLKFDDRAHGFIQFKNTDICMDCYCECGYHFHVDGFFTGAVICPKCKTVYAPNCFVELIAVKEHGLNPIEDQDEIDEESYWREKSNPPI